MARYYVYNLKSKDRMHIFVQDPDLFAEKEFDPATMEFSGVLVEAENPQMAQNIYMRPKAEDVLISCDEPPQTLLMRRIFERRIKKANTIDSILDQTEKVAYKMLMQKLITEIALDLNKVADKVVRVAECIRETSPDHPNVTIEQIYDQLIQSYGKEFMRLKYRPSEE